MHVVLHTGGTVTSAACEYRYYLHLNISNDSRLLHHPTQLTVFKVLLTAACTSGIAALTYRTAAPIRIARCR